MVQRAVIVAALLVIASVVGAYFYFTWDDGSMLRLPGIVEIQEVRLGSKVGGRVAKVLVQEGDLVNPGQELVVFEVPELHNLREQLQARLNATIAETERIINGARLEEKRAAQAAVLAAKARFDRLVEGWREEEKRSAISEWEAAKADAKSSEDEFHRIANLHRQGNVARSEYDLALGARDRAKGRLNVAVAKMDMVKAGSRKEDVAEAKAELERVQAKADELEAGSRSEDVMLAKAKVAEARSKLQEVEISLREAVVRVPQEFGKAVVEVLAIRPGDLVPPNQPVVRVLRAEDLWIKIFVPETRLGLVEMNREVEITIDSHPGKVFRGKVIQKANVSEFTPRNVQSAEERRYQMFGIKIRVEDSQGVFNAGMAAMVRIPVAK